MPCDTIYRRNQSVAVRKAEVKKAAEKIDALLKANKAKAIVGKQGAITFTGISDEDRDGLTDACIYRRIMATGSALARHMIVKAEQFAGRSVDTRVLATGVHSHDGGQTWGKD